jgi:hypothetical protein
MFYSKFFNIPALLVVLLASRFTFSQVENVPLTNPVYTYLKEMKVKNILNYISADIPNLSRFEVSSLLDTVRKNIDELSSTERNLLIHYEVEFSDSINNETTTRLFTPGVSFVKTAADILSQHKVKYLYIYRNEYSNFFAEGIGHFYHGQKLKHGVANSDLYDIGFRLRGTLFNHLGYYFSVLKGGVSGERNLAEIIEPRLKTSFKWVENTENIGNYDFMEAYLKYHTEVAPGMHISLQLGREPITVGFGYGSKLILSGDNPVMDFIKFKFDYGIIHYSSIHASTIGIFYPDQKDRYTKYWAFNSLHFVIPELFNIGIGETIVYSGRGIELAYLSPVGFYKFIEMSLQDRDNANMYFDIQTNFIPNLELQGTFLLDENILSNLSDLELYTNKTAYQVGAFWYEPFSLNDLSLILEYTKIRPYVYSHIDSENTYTAWGVNLGHRIGPNADEILSRLSYNVNEWLRLSAEYRHQRSGENIYDKNGNLIKNVGGDIFLSHGKNIPRDTEAKFLDGVRINTDIAQVGLRFELIRDFIFNLTYFYNIENNITKGIKEDYSYALFKFTLEY